MSIAFHNFNLLYEDNEDSLFFYKFFDSEPLEFKEEQVYV